MFGEEVGGRDRSSHVLEMVLSVEAGPTLSAGIKLFGVFSGDFVALLKHQEHIAMWTSALPSSPIESQPKCVWRQLQREEANHYLRRGGWVVRSEHFSL